MNNEINYGVIKNCSESCDSCLGENTTNDTNCIECASNYYKTEDSETNCILESLIPHNYYKNETDNIYYKCHQNCYNCTGHPESTNMNCLSCTENYYKFTDGCYPNNIVDNTSYLIEPSLNDLETT